MAMKERILTGWTIPRGLYLAFGLYIIIESVARQQWFGVVFGSYFAAMGLFAFGCASGACFGGNCAVTPNHSNAAVEPDRIEKE